MEIIDAYWEERNLGFKTYEIRLSKNDLDNVSEIIKNFSEDKFRNAYLVLKMPVSNIAALHCLEDNGFRFMETQFEMHKDIKDYITPDIINKFGYIVETIEITKDRKAWQNVLNLMTDNMYSTDRIYLDNKLPKNTSKKRYSNWIIDLIDNPNAHMYGYTYKTNLIGFGVSIHDENKKIVNDILKGVFEEYQNSCYGYFIFDSSIKKFKELGFNKIVTHISSNNFPIINLYQTFNYLIKNEKYVLRRFNCGKIKI